MKQDLDIIRRDVGLARIVTGAVLGFLFAVALMLGNALAAKPATAEEAPQLWNDRNVIVEQLALSYAEAPRALGITEDGAVLELFTTGDGATWTIMITLPNGLSRIVATGEHWIVRPLMARGRVS